MASWFSAQQRFIVFPSFSVTVSRELFRGPFKANRCQAEKEEIDKNSFGNVSDYLDSPRKKTPLE